MDGSDGGTVVVVEDATILGVVPTSFQGLGVMILTGAPILA